MLFVDIANYAILVIFVFVEGSAWFRALNMRLRQKYEPVYEALVKERAVFGGGVNCWL